MRRVLACLVLLCALVATLALPSVALAETVLEYDPVKNPVADNVTRLEVNKLERGSRDYVKGARMAIIEKETGTVVHEWTTDGTTQEVARELNVETHYILRELEAPAGYEKIDDIEFILHSVDFNTAGEIVNGEGRDDVEFAMVTGSGQEQAFVINAFDALKATQQEKVVHKKGSEVKKKTIVERLASTGDLLSPPLLMGMCVGGLACAAVGLRLRRSRS